MNTEEEIEKWGCILMDWLPLCMSNSEVSAFLEYAKDHKEEMIKQLETLK